MTRPIFYLLLLFTAPGIFATEHRADLQRGKLTYAKPGGELVDAPLLSTEVEFDIYGLTARARVKQIFKNESAFWVEGKYLFPLPEKSAVDTLEMKVGERIIVGEIQERRQAKATYEKAKISGKKASLVVQQRANVFTNSVANIGPFETIEVSIEYQQDLAFDDKGKLSLRFPMTMTQRYIPRTKIVEAYQDFSQGFQYQPSVFENITLPQKTAQASGNEVSIRVNLNTGLPLASLTSSSHQIHHQQMTEQEHMVELAGINHKADRDFVLSWQPKRGAMPRAALFSETIGDEAYISMMVLPPTAEAQAQVHPRETIFVIDTSGSMAGESIEQAKAALQFAISGLRAKDFFNLIEFNSDIGSLFQHAQPATADNKRQATQFIDRLYANGGTEMLEAMDAALDGKASHQRLRQVVFLTDGAISNEAALFRLIAEQIGDSRLFTVGIGSAPNAFFMRRAAQFGHGTATFIAEQTKASQKMQALFAQISQPLLTHIDIRWPVGSEVEMWPQKIPDLFAGQPLWLKAKVKQLSGEVEIRGRLANSLWQTRLSLTPAENQVGVAKLWARGKIAAIMDQSRHGRVDQKAQARITQVALQHHLVSRFTSLVAVDKTPSRVAEKLHSTRVPQTSPKGAAQVAYPKTAINFWLSAFDAGILFAFCCVLFIGLGRLSKVV